MSATRVIPVPIRAGRRRCRGIRPSPIAHQRLDALDDAVTRDQHPADDDEAEHEELQRGRQAERAHHLVQPGEEERRGERRQRTGQTSGERRPTDDDRGDRAEEVRRADVDPGISQQRGQRHPGDRVEDGGHHVDEGLGQRHPHAHHERRHRVGAHHLEATPDRGVPKSHDQRQGDGHADPEDRADAQEPAGRPVGQADRHGALDRERGHVAADDPDHDLARGEGDDQRVQLETADEDPVHQPDDGAGDRPP